MKSSSCILSSFCVYLIFIFCIGCSSYEPNDWQTGVPGVGFSSSPVAVDLTQDGILDIVVGAGAAEFQGTPYGVLALDGANGDILWSVPTRNQVVGTAISQDITADSIPDIFISGRSSILLAIDGKSGKPIWEYQPISEGIDLVNDTTYLNFSSPQWIPDVDNDGLNDIVIAFGGYVRAGAAERNRPVGSLKVISSQSGKVISQLLMPDGKESYMTPLVHDFSGTGNPSVIFGSGGEAIDGHLYMIGLEELVTKQTDKIQVLASGGKKGFVASPILADVTLDGTLDVIVSPVNGRMLCLDGVSFEPVWEIPMKEGFESYSMPGPGFFTGEDATPDFYASMGFGPWPNSDFCLNILVDGKTGRIVSRDTFGLFQYASPVIHDLTGDDKEDVLLVVNNKREFEISQDKVNWYVNELKIMDIRNGTSKDLAKFSIGANLGTTPLLTDLDQDGWLDVITCYMADPYHFYSFQKGQIVRTELKIKFDSQKSWTGFMGKGQNGKFIPVVKH
ncbi:MAG: hypothetical protein ACI9V1_002004 [Spirosomataceae bacterium]|jgi:hypothetical protein